MLKVKSNVSHNTRYTCLDTCFRVHFREENETRVPTARVGGRGERTRADQSGGEYVEKRRRWRRCDEVRDGVVEAVGRGGRKMTIIVILIICKGIVDFHAGQVWPQWRYIMTKTRRVGWVPFARQKARR